MRRKLSIELVLLAFEALALLTNMAWCRAAGCDTHWHEGSTSMACWCQRCGRLINVIPRS